MAASIKSALAEPLLPRRRHRVRSSRLIRPVALAGSLALLWCQPRLAAWLLQPVRCAVVDCNANHAGFTVLGGTTERVAERYVRCTADDCDTAPQVDDADLSADAAVVFTSQLFDDGSAAYFQRASVALERDGGANDEDDGDLLVDSAAPADAHGLLGFGGAFTDAAAEGFASVSTGLQAQLLRQYFGTDGIGYALGRVPIGGTDFSDRPYTYDDAPAGDLALANFSVAMDERSKLPLLRAALALSPRLELIGSPWSAPAWMKDSGGLVWGALLGAPGGRVHRAWAAYIVRFLDEYARRGVRLGWLTVQNEPWCSMVTRFTVRWNSMAMGAEELRDFIKADLGPALAAAHPHVRLLLHDDQRARLVGVAAVVMADPLAARYVAGAGFHWYDTMAFSWGGWALIDSLHYWDAVAEAARRWPQLTLVGTEAAEGFEPWARGPQLGAWWRLETYAYDMLNDLGAGARGWMDWNLWLDHEGGPNWAGNRCDAPIVLTPQRDAFLKQPTFYALAHFARFLPPGSRRLAVRAPAALDALAYLTPRRRVAVVLLNRDAAPHCLRLRDVRRRAAARLCMPPRSLHTMVWQAAPEEGLSEAEPIVAGGEGQHERESQSSDVR